MLAFSASDDAEICRLHQEVDLAAVVDRLFLCLEPLLLRFGKLTPELLDLEVFIGHYLSSQSDTDTHP